MRRERKEKARKEAEERLIARFGWSAQLPTNETPLKDRIEILRGGSHDAACLEIVAELVKRLKIAQSGIVALMEEADRAKRLSGKDKLRIMELGYKAAAESDLEVI